MTMVPTSPTRATIAVRARRSVGRLYMALAYSEGGADELVFYDITASAEHRPIDIGMVEAVARTIRIPFAVGGGISCVADMERVILAGAEKISVNSLAVRNPGIIAEVCLF